MGKKAKAFYLRPGPEKLLHKLLSTPEHHAKLKRKKITPQKIAQRSLLSSSIKVWSALKELSP